MVLAWKAHTDVKMDLWLVSACLSQTVCITAAEHIALIIQQPDQAWRTCAHWWGSIYCISIVYITCKSTKESREAVQNTQKQTSCPKCTLWVASSSPGWYTCDTLGSQQLCAAMHRQSGALPSKKYACELGGNGGVAPPLQDCHSSHVIPHATASSPQLV